MYNSYGYDGTGILSPVFLLLIAAFAVTLLASAVMRATVSTYDKKISLTGMTGWQTANRILSSNGMTSVQVGRIAGNLTDHYDPRSKNVNLSDECYGKNSIAAIAIAAHECGHAMQDAEGYVPLAIRSAVVPIANFGSSFSWIFIMVGLIFSMPVIARVGVYLFMAVVAFQLITLPVEINASHRAMKVLSSFGDIPQNELPQMRKVLIAAAMTYVAALASSILQLIRLMLITNRRRD